MRSRAGAVWVFVGVAYGLTWALWLPLLIEHRSGDQSELGLIYFLGSAGPLVGAVAASWWQAGTAGVRAWARRAYSLRVPRRWWLAVVAMPVGYLLIAWASARIIDGAWPSWSQLGITDKLPGLGTVAVLAVWVLTFGLGEESGWRGWLLPHLSGRFSVFASASIVAAVWMAWHLPAFWFNPTYAQMGAGILGWMLALVCGSWLLAWITQSCGWSVIPVLVWHAGFDLLTAADASSGVIASTISAVVMVQGVYAGHILWRRRHSAAELGPQWT